VSLLQMKSDMDITLMAVAVKLFIYFGFWILRDMNLLCIFILLTLQEAHSNHILW
jgi:hypothetical protein